MTPDFEINGTDRERKVGSNNPRSTWEISCWVPTNFLLFPKSKRTGAPATAPLQIASFLLSSVY